MIWVVFIAFVVIDIFLAEIIVFAVEFALTVRIVVAVAMFAKLFSDANVAEGFAVDIFPAAIAIDAMTDAIATGGLDLAADDDIILTSAALIAVLTVPVAVNMDSAEFAFEFAVVNIAPRAVLLDTVVRTILVDVTIKIIFAVLVVVPVGSSVSNLAVIDDTDLLESVAAVAWKLLDTPKAV